MDDIYRASAIYDKNYLDLKLFFSFLESAGMAIYLSDDDKKALINAF